IAAYWQGHDQGNEALKGEALRWLRGEFSTRTDARKAVGVRGIVEDNNYYDHLKLLARFVRLAGYSGLVVCLDEMVTLYKLSNTRARNANYEQVLRILNDGFQGTAEGLGFLFSGTPEFLTDERKGLFSYAALKSRLAENTFARDGLVDHTGPVLKLANLSPEDLYVLLGKLRHLYASGDETAYLLPDQGLRAFMAHCQQKIGEAYFRTPRNTITTFINLLAVLEQNPGTDHEALIGDLKLEREIPPAGGEIDEGEADDDLKSFRI
ncbi:MAG: ATP-binding protein, partial [Planctomycetes bacterium]|nr:ATP-binding protein [Planctomycetota bacterium]